MSDGPAHGSSSTDLSGHFSRCWNRDPVARNDLLLIRKNLTAAGVHQDLEPVNVIGAVLLMVAKRFNAREVFQSAALLIQERLIDSKIVGIAMHVDNGLLESDYLLPQSYKEILKAVSETVRLCQGLSVAYRCATGIRRVESRIGLRDEHDGCRVPLVGFIKSLLRPSDVSLIARSVLCGVRCRVAEIIAGALDIQGRVCHSVYCPAPVLQAWRRTSHAKTERRGLYFLVQLVLAQSEGSAEERRSLKVQLSKR